MSIGGHHELHFPGAEIEEFAKLRMHMLALSDAGGVVADAEIAGGLVHS